MVKAYRTFIQVWMLLLVIGSLTGCMPSNGRECITVFAAKSLNQAMDELIDIYSQKHEEIEFITNYDGSGVLQQQIEAGACCDIFISASVSQMDRLEEEGLLVADRRVELVNNQVCLVTYKGSQTRVTGLNNINLARSIAMASYAVPVGEYTRIALVNSGIIKNSRDTYDITAEEISDELNVPINECINVGAVATAVAEGSNEIGTVYYSDYRGYEDRLDIIEVIPYEMTGKVVYPMAQINNDNINKSEIADFMLFLQSEEAKAVFDRYYFDTHVE